MRGKVWRCSGTISGIKNQILFYTDHHFKSLKTFRFIYKRFIYLFFLLKYFPAPASSYLFESFLFALIQFLVLELPLTQLHLQLLNVLTECKFIPENHTHTRLCKCGDNFQFRLEMKTFPHSFSQLFKIIIIIIKSVDLRIYSGILDKESMNHLFDSLFLLFEFVPF